MNASTPKDSVELEIANFGPIVEAEIDLRPLTVFVGPSNTGKSYLAILIYALHRFFSGSRDSRMLRRTMNRKLPPNTYEAVDKWAQQTIADRSIKESIVLPDSVTSVIRSVFDAQGDQLGSEIGRCFGIDKTGALVRKGNKGDARVVFRRHVSNDAAPLEHKLTFKTQGTEFATKIPPGMSMQIDVGRGDWWIDRLRYTIEHVSPDRRIDEERKFIIRELTELLIDLALPQLGGPIYRPAFYLPADRTGVMHAHSVVVSAMIGSAPMAGLRPAAGTPMLSGVLADFLQQLIEIDRPPYRRRRSRRDFGKQIEETILGGSVRVDRSETISYPHFTYQPKGWKESLPLMNASSMVSELAPVVLYLRHFVQPGETLIVEEPESHLHPAMQVEFTRQIAALVHAGVRVIVTTHSEWVLEELGNIVRRSELPKARRKEIPRGEFALRSDQVGAWLFEPKSRPKGSIVKEIRLDDSGLFPSKFDEVARVLHNDWADISSWIGGAA